jgi:glycolate oxidase iron-sulfur subunit
MQTSILKSILNTPRGQEADAILRRCVHCGFCTATCPTYQLLGDELDSPRGRIYLIKQLLEGQAVTRETRTHLDRCLTCRACETTCPSGVQYGRLVDMGREMIEQQQPRPSGQRLLRWSLRKIIPYPARFNLLLNMGRLVSAVLPAGLRRKLPQRQQAMAWPQQSHTRRMLVLAGCAQSSVTPNTNAALAHVLDMLDIQLIEADKAGCCGAVSQHLAASDEALNAVRNNIDAWWPYVEEGVEAIVVTASGCGVMVKDYGHLLQHDVEYADKAQRIGELARDPAEILRDETLPRIEAEQKIAFHSPCTLQHGLQLNGVVEDILKKVGYELTPVADAHLCCGSAGTYSILQPQLSKQLQHNKLRNLQTGHPEIIATANIGCQMHLAQKAEVPVKHWLELLR